MSRLVALLVVRVIVGCCRNYTSDLSFCQCTEDSKTGNCFDVLWAFKVVWRAQYTLMQNNGMLKLTQF